MSVSCGFGEIETSQWYYSKSKKVCLKEQSCKSSSPFANQFASKELCEQTCAKLATSESSLFNKSKSHNGVRQGHLVPDVNVDFELSDCLLPSAKGNCLGIYSRYTMLKNSSIHLTILFYQLTHGHDQWMIIFTHVVCPPVHSFS